MLLLALLLGFCVATRADFAGAVDEVREKLPDFDFDLAFKHYSGYLSSIDNSRLHYWLFESSGNASTDPLLVWLNGGPGASSLLGALTENGPFLINSAGRWVSNPYAWNARASVVYIESPAGVGFSYNLDHTIKAGDNYTAELNYAALVDFFQKFPQYQSNDLYITGESYGGIYVPTLSTLVLERHLVTNFKGLAIGNGVYDWDLMDKATLPFFAYHAMVDSVVWDQLLEGCCPNVTNVRHCDTLTATSAQCEAARGLVSIPQVNPYNIYADCLHPSQRYALLDRFRPSIASFQKTQAAYDSLPCGNDTALVAYLNRPDVRKILHIQPESLKWSSVSLVVNRLHQRDYLTMKPFFQKLIKAKLRIMIYNGDVDSVCNFLSNQWFVEELAMKVSKPYSAWYVNRQIAGMVKAFGEHSHFVFATIRGSGHMVPTDKPEVAQAMINNFLEGESGW